MVDFTQCKFMDDSDRKRVVELQWDGESITADDTRLLKSSPGNAIPEWIVNAANNGVLSTGRIGWMELRSGGETVFQPEGRYV